MKKFKKSFETKINSYENKWGEEARLFHLVEEVGELFEIILHYKGHKKIEKNKKDIEIALSDVIEDVLALAYIYKIDFDALFQNVIKVDEEH